MNIDNRKTEWVEDLPPLCPPGTAYVPNGKSFYRVVENKPPKDIDFFSHRKRFPTQRFSTNECHAHAVSIFSKIKGCKRIQKLPRWKWKKTFIIKINLVKSAGVIEKFGHGSHYSWWLRKGFKPEEVCEFI